MDKTSRIPGEGKDQQQTLFKTDLPAGLEVRLRVVVARPVVVVAGDGREAADRTNTAVQQTGDKDQGAEAGRAETTANQEGQETDIMLTRAVATQICM